MIHYLGRDYPNPVRDSEQDTALYGSLDGALTITASTWLGIPSGRAAFAANLPDDVPWVAVHRPTRARGKMAKLVELAVLQLDRIRPGHPGLATNHRYARRCVVWCTPDEIGTNEELRGKILLLV